MSRDEKLDEYVRKATPYLTAIAKNPMNPGRHASYQRWRLTRKITSKDQRSPRSSNVFCGSFSDSFVRGPSEAKCRRELQQRGTDPNECRNRAKALGASA